MPLSGGGLGHPTPRRVSILRRHADLLVSGVCRSVLPVAARFAPVVSWSHGYRVQPRGEAGQEARRSPAQVRRDCAPPPGWFGGFGTHRWVGQGGGGGLFCQPAAMLAAMGSFMASSLSRPHGSWRNGPVP